MTVSLDQHIDALANANRTCNEAVLASARFDDRGFDEALQRGRRRNRYAIDWDEFTAELQWQAATEYTQPPDSPHQLQEATLFLIAVCAPQRSLEQLIKDSTSLRRLRASFRDHHLIGTNATIAIAPVLLTEEHCAQAGPATISQLRSLLTQDMQRPETDGARAQTLTTLLPQPASVRHATADAQLRFIVGVRVRIDPLDTPHPPDAFSAIPAPDIPLPVAHLNGWRTAMEAIFIDTRFALPAEWNDALDHGRTLLPTQSDRRTLARTPRRWSKS